LKIPLRLELEALHGRRRSADAAERETTVERPFPARIEELIAVDSHHIGVPGKKVVEPGIAKLAVHAREQRTDAGTSAAEFLEHPAGKVIRQGLDFGARALARVGDL